MFVREQAGGVEIPATLEHAGPSFYATVLERDGVRVSTARRNRNQKKSVATETH